MEASADALDSLAIEACAACLAFMHAAKKTSSAGDRPMRAEIDLPRLTSWFESLRGPVARGVFADAAATRNCIAYENFYKTVTSVTERTDGGYDDTPLIIETTRPAGRP